MTDMGVRRRNAPRELPKHTKGSLPMDDYQSLSHTKWECRYHVVFIPECRGKKLYGHVRKDLGEVFRELARRRERDCRRVPHGRSRAHDDIDSTEIRGVPGSRL
jgi:hypothetical protein